MAFLLPWVIGTAALSGVFGMAGGMVLLLVLTNRLPLAEAMVLHGALQLVSNGSRAVISARHIRLDIVARFGLAALLTALACFTAMLLSPGLRDAVVDVRVVLIATGVIAVAEPLLALWRERSGTKLAGVPQADTKLGALLCGAAITGLHLTSGAAGPLLDAFFVDSPLGRNANVATKAAVQSVGHSLKIAYFAVLAALGLTAAQSGSFELASAPSFALLAIASVAGTWLGRQVLDRMTDIGFRRGTRAIVCAIGVVSLARGFFA